LSQVVRNNIGSPGAVRTGFRARPATAGGSKVAESDGIPKGGVRGRSGTTSAAGPSPRDSSEVKVMGAGPGKTASTPRAAALPGAALANGSGSARGSRGASATISQIMSSSKGRTTDVGVNRQQQ
jgi:hypothetical protein